MIHTGKKENREAAQFHHQLHRPTQIEVKNYPKTLTILTRAHRRRYIENFWDFAKTRLSRFRGMSKKTFLLHLPESECRFNHRGEDLYILLLKNPQ